MFRFFRRYQKTLIVVAGVILMFVFTVADSLTTYLRSQADDSGGRQPDDVAVTWEGGQLTEAELSELINRRLLVDRFVRAVYQEGEFSAAMGGRSDLPVRVQPVGLVDRNASQTVLENDVVMTHILAERGRELGIQFPDSAITDYINELGRGELGAQDIRAILQQLNPAGRRISEQVLYDALRQVLTAESMAKAYGAGRSFSDMFMFAAELPVNRWEEWKRVNDRVRIEAAAIDPATALIDVPEPSDEELRAYYEEYKDRVDFPIPVEGVELPTAEPGFKVPRKIALQYLRANFDEFVDRYSEEVTDEQIATYYEENKDRFIAADSFDDIFEDESQDDDAAESDADQAGTDSDDPPADGEQADGPEAATETGDQVMDEAETSEPDAESDEATEAEPGPADEASDADAEQGDAADSEEVPADGNNEDADEAESTDEEGDGSAARAQPSPFRLAAYQQQGDQEEAESAESSASDDPSGDQADADTASEVETPEEQQTPDDDAASTAASDETSDAASGDTEESAADDEELSGPTDEDTPMAEADSDVEYQPLEEVRDEIRRNIAEERFFSEVDTLMIDVATELNPLFNRYVSAMLDAEVLEEEVPAPPEGLRDLSPLAEKYNLEYEETEPMNAIVMRDSEVGRSIEDQKYGGRQVWQVMFGTDIELYEPIISADVARFGDRYLVMKTSDEPERVPSFEEVRDQVADAWRRSKAAELALEKAKETAAEAEESGLSLEDYFLDNSEIEVTETSSFTHYTEGDVAPTGQLPTYRLSQPEGLEHVGPDFMEGVFNLEQGEVTALLNYDHSVVYVVRLADAYESTSQLRSDFLEQTNFWSGRYAFRGINARDFRNAALQSVLDDLNLEWQRPDEDDTAAEDAE